MTVITLLNLKHFLVTSWIMSKRYITKSKFHVCYHFFRYGHSRRKNFINASCPKHRKSITWNKKWDIFYFHTLWCLRKVSSFWGTGKNGKKCENKKLMSFFSLISLGRQGLRLRFVEFPTYIISVPLTIEIHKHNIDTFRVTNKQYYKIILF